LAWLVRGCLEWQRIGLAEPESVRQAVGKMRKEMNNVERFVDEWCIKSEDGKVSPDALYNAYTRWSRAAREEPFSKHKFGLEIGKLGFPLKPSNSQYHRECLALGAKAYNGFEGGGTIDPDSGD
jgi:putative DNA primase/helicase